MALIARENGLIRNALGALMIVPVMIVAMPLVAIAALFSGPAKMSADDVANYLRARLNSTDGEWDWDDFTSVEIADPILEAIRCDAAAIEESWSDAAKKLLSELLDRAEAQRVGTGSPPG